jgi:hypothetical protein
MRSFRRGGCPLWSLGPVMKASNFCFRLFDADYLMKNACVCGYCIWVRSRLRGNAAKLVDGQRCDLKIDVVFGAAE